jgi:excisionase family DNA binding protein
MSTNLPRLTFTVREVCQSLQISRTTLWKLVRSRKLKPLRIGRRVLFTMEALQAFLNGGRRG